ncbi:WASH complex subunit 1 [Lutzomyia longipalpis]|uniref:WASH complex subunit 1 n=1 Tax=Lutzomyia longipalpis TaxID=7200 RepID=UPI002483C602|nr:WASH complex subunit 1 [Lutzomyia longipalpis]
MNLYSIPVIQQDLRHEEAIIQAANTFELLENVINDVFATINKRIDKNNARVDDIQRRIAVANAKVESLVGIKKAITIYSPAKYPAGESVPDIEVTFPAHKEPLIQLNEDYTVESSLDPTSHKRLQDKLHFYHVRKVENSSGVSLPEGLGAPPDNIESINSFLLFNTTENPYEHYKKVDPLSGTIRTTSSSTAIEDESQKMEAAPLSISNRNAQPKKVPENFFYTPQFDEAPALDVPDDLPDLPGIAGDVMFTEGLPKVPVAVPAAQTPGEISTLLPTDDELDLHAPIVRTLAVPEVEDRHVDETPSAAPPPPPPQPLPEPPAASTPLPKDASGSKLPPMTDARSNLMEAIRQAGGKAKLRAAEQKPAGKKETSAPAAGDLMADLHNKLSMRRKGISGAKDPSGVMDKMSALIPPPPKPTASTTDASEDDDWE